MSQSQKWKVVSTGLIKEDYLEEAVISRLQDIFSLSENSAKKIINGTPVVLKKDLEQAEAYKYKTALEKIGLTIVLERMPLKIMAIPQLSLEPMDEKPIREPAGESQEKPQLELAPQSENRKGQEAPKASGLLLNPSQMECPKCEHVQLKATECLQCGIIISRYMEKEQNDRFSHGKFEINNTKNPPLRGEKSAIVRIFGGASALLVIFLIYHFILDRASFQPLGGSKEATAQISAMWQAKNHKGPDLDYIRGLLDSGQYSQLEFILNELNENFKNDVSWEDAYQETIDGMSPANNFSLNAMHRWVNKTESAYAYLARGAYYTDAGLLARGNCYARCTTEEQFSTQRELHKKALDNLLVAKSKNSTLLPIYSLLIIAGNTQEVAISFDGILQEAISKNPGGFYYRYQYLRIKMPKWGGSYAEMNEFVEATSQYNSLNPRLWILGGFAPAEMAYRSMKEGFFDKCIAQYSDALQFGVNSRWLRYRAYCLSQEGLHEQALEDVNLSLELHDDDYARKLKSYLVNAI